MSAHDRHDPPSAPVVVVRDRARVVDAEERRSHGRDHWVDGTFGRFEQGRRSVVLSPNGPNVLRQERRRPRRRGVIDLDAGPGTDVAISGLPPLVDYASGGPVFHDDRRGVTLLFYHGEVHHLGDATRFWSFIGVAVSRDAGEHFRDLGPVVEPHESLVHWLDHGDRCVEIGSGGFVVADGEFDLYFTDASAPMPVNLGAVHAPVDEVVDAAVRGEGVAWRRRRSRTNPFDTSDLFPRRWGFHFVRWFDVAVDRETGRRLMIYSCESFGRWNLFVTWSDDGTIWSAPTPLLERPSAVERLYVTIDSGVDGEPRRVVASELSLYVVASAVGGFDRWDDATIERWNLSITER